MHKKMKKMPRYIFRLGKIPFSKNFFRTLRSENLIISRRNRFGRSAVLINHGNHEPITVRRKVRRFYIINQPDYIKFSSNKNFTHKMLKEYCPHIYSSPSEVKSYPVVVKPAYGFQGTNVRKVNNERELRRRIHSINSSHIIQDFIDPMAEYRFNILDDTIYQISRKELIEGWNGKFNFEWVSLGENAQLSSKFYRYVESITDSIHNYIGNNLGSYAIDIIKGKDKNYYLSELNSAFGIGNFTINRLTSLLDRKYSQGELEKYRVK